MKKIIILLTFIFAFGIVQSQIGRYPYSKGIASAGGGYCDEYQAVYDAMTNKPSSSVAAAQNTMVETIVAGNGGTTWDKLLAAWNFANEVNTDDEALINLVNPGTFDATITGSPAFTAFEGFQGAVGKYGCTNITPSTEGGTLFTLNDCSMGVYTRTTSTSTVSLMAATDGESNIYTAIVPYTSADNAGFGMNEANWGNAFSNTGTAAFWIAVRTASDAEVLYKNGSSVKTTTRVSTSLPPQPVYFNTNNGVSAGDWQISFGFMGAALDQTDVTVITNAVETYMDSNSKGIIE